MTIIHAKRNSDGEIVTAYENGKGFDIWVESKDISNDDTMSKIGWINKKSFKNLYTEIPKETRK